MLLKEELLSTLVGRSSSFSCISNSREFIFYETPSFKVYKKARYGELTMKVTSF